MPFPSMMMKEPPLANHHGRTPRGKWLPMLRRIRASTAPLRPALPTIAFLEKRSERC